MADMLLCARNAKLDLILHCIDGIYCKCDCNSHFKVVVFNYCIYQDYFNCSTFVLKHIGIFTFCTLFVYNLYQSIISFLGICKLC